MAFPIMRELHLKRPQTGVSNNPLRTAQLVCYPQDPKRASPFIHENLVHWPYSNVIVTRLRYHSRSYRTDFQSSDPDVVDQYQERIRMSEAMINSTSLLRTQHNIAGA